MKRKWLIRAAVILGVCMATLLIAAPAMAMWDWCDRDPVLNIGGHTVSLDVSIKGDPQEIRGHIVFSVSVPEGTQVSVISCEPDAKVLKFISLGEVPPTEQVIAAATSDV